MTQVDTVSVEAARTRLSEGSLGEAFRALPRAELGSPERALRALLKAELGDAVAAAADLAGTDDTAPCAAIWASIARGVVAVARAEVETAILAFDDAIHRARQHAEPQEEVRALLRAARALLDRDGPADASAALGRLADARTRIDGDPTLDVFRLELRGLLARGRAAAGDLEGAIDDAQKVASDAADAGRPDMQWRAFATLGALEGLRGADFLARRHDLAAIEVLEALAVRLPRELREAFWQDPARRTLRARASATTERYAAAAHQRREDRGEGFGARTERLLELLKRLASEHDMDRLLERITDAAVELSGAERGFVLLPDESGALQARLVRASGAGVGDPSVAFSQSIAEAVLIDGQPILTVDARDDQRLDEFLSVHKLMLRSVACLPIRSRQGILGVLYLEHRLRKGRFRERDVDLLLAFADQAAIALQNARFVAQLEARSGALEAANQELADAKAEIERVLEARTDQLNDARRELDRARQRMRGRHRFEGMLGRSEAMRRVFAVIERVRETHVPVVIQGESGTGKELAARAIHHSSGRSANPFIALNCAAIPEALLESELFGHVRGAFTGADRDRRGVLSRATGGTLFLDEVGDMPSKMQVDLLRVLQDGRVRPVGGDEDEVVDVRILSASNKSLRDLVSQGVFREDLYYRLNVVEIVLPALRDRHGDLPLLCEYFLERIGEEAGEPPKRITRAALDTLSAHPLPGNVRQLEHLLLNACVMTAGDVIDRGDLALEEPAANERIEAPSLGPTPSHPPAQSLDDFKENEKQKILAALEEQNWNRARAARHLGIPRRTFYRRLREHGIL